MKRTTVRSGVLRHARRVLVVVVVLNVALGLAFSIIGLRHQADDRARIQTDLAHRAALVDSVEAALWTSIEQGAVSPQLARADLSAIGEWSSRPHNAVRRVPVASSFAASVAAARRSLRAADVSSARVEAGRAEARRATLLQQLHRISRSHERSSERAATIADVETIVLMLFAAGMGLLMFRRTVAIRLNGDLREARERARAEARFVSLVRHSSDLISIVEPDSTILYQTSSARRMLGYDPDALVGTPLLDLVHPEDRIHLVAAHDSLLAGGASKTSTLRLRAADGTWRHVESVHTDLREDDRVGGIVITSRDVSERIALEGQLRHSAFHDALTGLANRALFIDRVQHALSRHTADDETTVVVFLDLDDFKAVNDALGHQVGDDLLVEVGRRLARTVREGDTVARLGGDEFGILLEGAGDGERATLLARVQEELRRSVRSGERELTVHASLGVAQGRQGQDAQQLLANADLAMYAAKAAGKDTALDFEASMSETAERQLELRTDLQRAIRERELRAYFQPVFSLESGELHGFEALARWLHPQRGLLAPGDFIPLAEQTGQIVEIGRLILRQACRALRSWQDVYPQDHRLTMAVNLSARELDQPDLLEAVSAIVGEEGIAPADLTLEVTETLLVSDHERATRQLSLLRNIGVQVAIDDFGTGYSSLSYLEQLPVDVVKIDKSFVDRISTDQPNMIIEAIARLSSRLGLRTVAEGIEQPQQADVLRTIGCDVGQGFLFSRPKSPDEIETLLAELSPARAPHTDKSTALL